MSSGPDHYLLAEMLLGTAARAEVQEAAVIARAQVHATLALAAATADTAVTRWLGDENHSGAGWSQVTA